jgi:hypothetical protein
MYFLAGEACKISSWRLTYLYCSTPWIRPKLIFLFYLSCISDPCWFQSGSGFGILRELWSQTRMKRFKKSKTVCYKYVQNSYLYQSQGPDFFSNKSNNHGTLRRIRAYPDTVSRYLYVHPSHLQCMIIVLILGWESGPVDQVALVQVQRHAGRPLPQHHARWRHRYDQLTGGYKGWSLVISLLFSVSWIRIRSDP